MLMGFGLLLNISLLAQCPTGDVLITSQTDADNYASTFPNCDTLPGDLVFSGINIDDLSGFAHVEVIQGDLHYNNTFPGPYDFTGFQSLTHIGGDLQVTHCQYWRSFAGLDNLERVEGSVVAQYVESQEEQFRDLLFLLFDFYRYRKTEWPGAAAKFTILRT